MDLGCIYVSAGALLWLGFGLCLALFSLFLLILGWWGRLRVWFVLFSVFGVWISLGNFIYFLWFHLVGLLLACVGLLGVLFGLSLASLALVLGLVWSVGPDFWWLGLVSCLWALVCPRCCL